MSRQWVEIELALCGAHGLLAVRNPESAHDSWRGGISAMQPIDPTSIESAVRPEGTRFGFYSAGSFVSDNRVCAL